MNSSKELTTDKLPVTFDFVANPYSETAVVNIKFLQQLTSTLSEEKDPRRIVQAFRMRLRECETKDQFLECLEDEFVFHKTVDLINNRETKRK